ncbi:MAG TPA: RNA polymerase sigma factor [Candidatus Limnocylindrales bacterium]
MPAADHELIRRMQLGDLDAFEALFRRYRAPIYRTAYGLTGDPHAAEEVLLDTFARAYRRRDTLLPSVSPLPWLHRVALNLCYSRLSRRRLAQEPITDLSAHRMPDDAPQPAERAEQAELRVFVREGIARLPEKQRSVVVLYYLQRMSLQETADTLGIQVGTVKSRLYYALRTLRSHLEGDRRLAGGYLPVTDEEAQASTP